MSEESKPKNHNESYLMWECFLNWSATLEKIDRGQIKREDKV